MKYPRPSKRIIERQLNECIERINVETAAFSAHGMFSAGLANEGYAGGYRQALYDFQLILNGVRPNSRYWPEPPEE